MKISQNKYLKKTDRGNKFHKIAPAAGSLSGTRLVGAKQARGEICV